MNKWECWAWAVWRHRYLHRSLNTQRPEYKKLVADIQASKIKAVVVKKLDRLSRSLVDFEQLMGLLQTHGVEFISLRENFDTPTAMGKAMLRIALVFAQLEREQTAERGKDIFSWRAEQGFFNGGIPPLGQLLTFRLNHATFSPKDWKPGSPKTSPTSTS